MSHTPRAQSPALMEQRSIGYVPRSERHGHPFSQFTLWFGANLHITSVITGALAVVLGGDVVWSVVGLAVGQVLGGCVMALHAVQGPRLGLPQMISSRAQFGVYGAAVPLLLVILMYLGFSASGTVLAGESVAALAHMPDWAGILVFGAVTTVIAVVGYRLIHMIGRLATVISSLTFLYLTIRLLSHADLGALLGNAHFTWPSFLVAAGLSASWQIAFGPYVADYSRYLPYEVRPAQTFWFTLLGSTLASQWAMMFGVAAAAIAGTQFKGHEVTFIVGLGGSGLVAALIYFVIALGKLCVNVLNAYGGFMSTITTITGFRGHREISNGARLFWIALIMAAATGIALVGQQDFLHTFHAFLLFLLTFFTPWSAINLTDFYLVAKERYDVTAIADPKGPYGGWNWGAIGAFAFGVLAQLPFLYTDFYTGPMVETLGGADISWIVGLVATSAAYWVACRWDRRVIPERTVLPDDEEYAAGR
ncbi:purine-cytosine permease family protein [Arthrobacter sp. UM1]|uniref:purine-cytosine permease family protein n=1 Tax=Arthrobacter sp. UM1 TaxID=2766776 RepID=UPI001CF6C69B|nr:cytosine permease [Arthrobacter sp. UM1]